MFTGKLFLGLRAGKDTSTFSNKGILIMTRKVIDRCEEGLAIAFPNDDLGKLAKSAITEFLQYGGSRNIKITPVTGISWEHAIF